jgi:hypothetical protein
VQLNGEEGPFSWEAGLRVEDMTLEVDGAERGETTVLPSGHFSLEVSDGARIRGSA